MADVQIVTVTLSDGTPVRVIAGTPLHELYLALAGFTTTADGGLSDIDLSTLRVMAWFMTPHGPQSVIEPATIAEFRRRDYLEITAQQAADFFAGAVEIPDVSFITGQELPGAMAAAAADEDSAFAVALGAAFVPSTGDSTVTGVKTFEDMVVVHGTVLTQGYQGFASPGMRSPFSQNLVIDGSTLSSANPSDKVAVGTAVTFKGGFSGEAGYGASNPGFLWGANDFIITGTTSGDIAGIDDIQARLTEVHMQTPGATINTVSALIAESNVNSVGGTVTGWLASVTARAPENRSTPKASVAKAAALLVQSPAANTATLQYALHVEGEGLSYLGGDIDMNGDPSAPKTLDAHHGTVRARHLKATNGGGAGTHAAVLQLSYGGTDSYPNWISTLHSGTSAGTEIALWTNDGTDAGTFPTNAIRGLVVTNKSVQAGGGAPSHGGGVGVIGVTNASTVPASNPGGGGVLYAEGGALKWRGSSGTVTTVAPA